MAHAALKTGALLSVLAASAPAGAQTGFQAAVHGGAECPIGCDDVDPLIGATAFVVPGRVGAVGAIYEYVHTQAERNTSLMRYGLAVRGYVVRDTLQPYVQLALGAARYEEDAGACEYEGKAFLQLGVGLEARIGGDWFGGVATGVNALLATGQCSWADGDDGHPRSYERERSPSFMLAVSLRYGPSS